MDAAALPDEFWGLFGLEQYFKHTGTSPLVGRSSSVCSAADNKQGGTTIPILLLLLQLIHLRALEHLHWPVCVDERFLILVAVGTTKHTKPLNESEARTAKQLSEVL